MLSTSVTRGRVLGLVLAVSAGAGIGLAAPTVWSAPRGTASPTERVSSAPRDIRDGVPKDTQNDVQNDVRSDTPTAPRQPQVAATQVTLDEAIAIAARTAPGRVVETDTDTGTTGIEYEVTILHADGTVSEIDVDAGTGQVVGRKLHNEWDAD